ncbi:CPBP family intramembrane glutamic endopeptidase [Actinomadura sp. DC4]|uniref:CPBP family intramembrane glutamic endopeptidase n=1 Tax=Actinomadura sp. DC4 TaxID=3055069 RepID=UPI0025B11668|nr:CPBP family intramembrane glutamic endopeptidase [Actinomadura sp. DC4]MDN3354867.1 CPBP family intramembrane metalloprotease [Actinomadura sp. DC4]
MTERDSVAEQAEAAPASPKWSRPAWIRLVVLLVLFVLVDGVIGAVYSALKDHAVLGLLCGLVLTALVLLAYAKAVRFLEGRDVVELARDGAVARVRRGLLIGLVLFAVAIGIIAMFGGYGIDGWGSVGGVIASVGLMSAAAVAEEVLFRGVLFRIVEEMAGTWGAMAVSAVVFGALHLVNPHATIWGAIAIMIEAGLMLGAAYAATRTLWLPIGLHLAWNFAEGAIFGVTVSGSGDGPQGLVKGTLSGSAVLTGGTFGPEASVVAILVCGVPTVLFLRLAKQRGNIRSRKASRPSAG